MDKKGIEFIVGLTVVIAIIILTVGTIWMGEYRLGKRTYTIEVLFDNAAGLKVGDPVKVLGVNRGDVKKIILRKHSVLVQLKIDADVKLFEDAKITIQDVGIVGEKCVTIYPGNSNLPHDISKPLQGKTAGGLNDALMAIGELASPEIVYSIKQILLNTSELTQELKELATQNVEVLQTSIENINAVSENLRLLIESNSEGLSMMISRFNTTSERMDKLVSNLEVLSNSMHILTQKIEKGEGTLGKLINDKELYDELRRTTQNVDALILDIKQNPRKYLPSFELF